MENAGKILVLCIVAFSLLFCSYALVLFTRPIDWEWVAKYKPKEFGKETPSQMDRRKAQLARLAAEKAQVVAGWSAARQNLVQTEANIAANQLWYTQQLERLQSNKDPKDLDVKDLKRDATGLLVLDTPRDRTGKPVFDKVVAKGDYDRFSRELSDLLTQTTKVRTEMDKVIQQEKELTEELNGTVDSRGRQLKGLYALVSLERNVQRRAREELEDLKPSYYQELVDSQLLLKRQRSLRFRLNQLKDKGLARR